MDTSGNRQPPRGLLTTLARVLLGLSISAVLAWLVLRGLDWALVKDTFAGMSPLLGVLALLVFIASNFLRAYRWRLLFLEEEVSVARLFIVENEGLGLNNLVPVRVAAEAVQWAVLTVRDGTNGATTLASLGMVRVLDVVASTFILGVAFIFIPEMSNFTIYVVGAVGFAVVVMFLVWLLAWSNRGFPLVRRIPALHSFTKAVATLASSPRILGYALLLSVVYWLMIGMTVWVVALSLNISMSPATATVAVMGTIFFATAVPSAPAAVGTFEAAMMYVLGYFGVERELAFGYAVMVHAILFLPPSLIALIFLPGEGVGAFSQLRSLTGQFNRSASRAG